MEKISLRTVTNDHLAAAHSAHAGRSSITLVGGSGHHLRQTLITMTSGTTLGEHESPGEASLLVLTGRVRLASEGHDSVDAGAGDLVVIPPERHSLEALEDAGVILTVVKDI